MSQLTDSEQRNEIVMNKWREYLEDKSDSQLNFLCDNVCNLLSGGSPIGPSRELKIKHIMEWLTPEDDISFMDTIQ